MDIEIIYSVILKNLSNFYHSTAFFVVKIFLGIYVAALIYDMIMLLIARGVGSNLREFTTGANVPLELTRKKDKTRMKWENIRKRLFSGNESEYKVAIIEADNMIDDLLQKMGYKGANMGERLNVIPAGHFGNLDEMKQAHEIRNRIIHEADFRVSQESAKELIGKYEHILKTFEVLD